MKAKVEFWLRLLAILGVLVAAWAIGINQIATIMENAHDVQVRSAEAQCVEFGAPHAVVADGTAYCYLIHQGSEQMLPLETLQKLYAPKYEGS